MSYEIVHQRRPGQRATVIATVAFVSLAPEVLNLVRSRLEGGKLWWRRRK